MEKVNFDLGLPHRAREVKIRTTEDFILPIYHEHYYPVVKDLS